MATTALSTGITKVPGSKLYTLTLANTAYQFQVPVGRWQVAIEAHGGAVSVILDEAIADAATVVPADWSVIADAGFATFEFGATTPANSYTRSRLFSLASATAGAKALVTLVEVD